MIRALFRLSGTAQFAIFVGIVVIVVIVVFLVSGGIDLGGDDNDDPLAIEQVEDGDAEDGTPAEGNDGASTVSARQVEGRAFQFGDLRIVVTDLRLTTSVSEGRDTVEAIERFASVLLTVRNSGTAPVSLGGGLLLIDGQGRTFTPNAIATAAVALRDDSRLDALTTALQPGIATDLVVVFDVPEEASGLRLRVAGGYVDVDLDG